MEPEIDLPPDVYLEVTKKDGESFRFPITKKTVTIGRDPGCDLHLEDEFVSRKHCQIVFRGDHFTVMDLGSLNKTVVKGKEYIQKNLMTGNRIDLGQTRLRFVWDNYLQWRREHGLTEEPGEEPIEEGAPDQAGPGPGEPGAE
jgi:pSer/pThr/pTyr-binding forkhead associated (FHA) protein